MEFFVESDLIYINRYSMKGHYSGSHLKLVTKGLLGLTVELSHSDVRVSVVRTVYSLPDGS